MAENEEKEPFFTKPLLIIFLTIFIDLVGFGIVIPLLPFFAEEFNATPVDIGLLMASFSLMQFIFAPIWGNLSDRYGRRPILFFTILGSSIGYLMLGFAGSLAVIYAGRILAGITGGNLSTAQAYIADVTSRENRARGMGLFGMAFGLGFILGPAISGVLSKFGMHVPFLFAASLSFLNAVLLFIILPESRTPGSHASRASGLNRFAELFKTLRDSRFTTIAIEYFLLVTAFSIMTTSFAYFTMVNFGYNAENTGYLLAFVGFTAAIMQGGVFGALAKRVGEAVLAAAGSLILLISLFVVPYISSEHGGLSALLLGLGVFAIGNSLASPALTSLASKTAHEHEQGTAMGLMQSGASLARVIGPLLCGFLLNNAANSVDASTLFRTYWTAAAIMLAAFITAAYFALSLRSKGLERTS